MGGYLPSSPGSTPGSPPLITSRKLSLLLYFPGRRNGTAREFSVIDIALFFSGTPFNLIKSEERIEAMLAVFLDTLVV